MEAQQMLVGLTKNERFRSNDNLTHLHNYWASSLNNQYDFLVIIYTYQLVLAPEQLNILSSLRSRAFDEMISGCY